MGADQNHNWQMSIASALEWWRDAGVDCEVDDNPRDWFARTPAPGVSPPAIDVAAGDEQKLPDTLEAFTAWRLGAGAPEAGWPGQLLGPQGDLSHGLMIVVDMPEREDEAAGELLAGAAGKLFDRMLAAIGRDRQSIYLTALALKRPAAGRINDETGQKLESLIRHQLSLAGPKSVLALGNAASRAITGLDVTDARGVLREVNHDRGTSNVVASFHPRFLLERPTAKADAWKDLKMLIGK